MSDLSGLLKEWHATEHGKRAKLYHQITALVLSPEFFSTLAQEPAGQSEAEPRPSEEEIARIIDPKAFVIVNSKRMEVREAQRQALNKARAILALPQVSDAGTDLLVDRCFDELCALHDYAGSPAWKEIIRKYVGGRGPAPAQSPGVTATVTPSDGAIYAAVSQRDLTPEEARDLTKALIDSTELAYDMAPVAHPTVKVSGDAAEMGEKIAEIIIGNNKLDLPLDTCARKSAAEIIALPLTQEGRSDG